LEKNEQYWQRIANKAALTLTACCYVKPVPKRARFRKGARFSGALAFFFGTPTAPQLACLLLFPWNPAFIPIFWIHRRTLRPRLLPPHCISPNSAVGTNGEKTFRGERFFVRVRFIGKRYCAGHVVPKMQQKMVTICLSTIAVLELRNSG
jgi:hypothetical protein